MQPLYGTIKQQRAWVLSTLQRWCAIHSGTDCLGGLEQMLQELKSCFLPLGGEQKVIQLFPEEGFFTEQPLGKALHISCRPEKKVRILFSGHMDIAYPAHLPLEPSRLVEGNLVGRGTADMKAGLLVLFLALQAFEKSPFASQIGWEIVITPDEEIGSPGSALLLKEIGKRCAIGCVFEPCFADGAIVNARKGSSNFRLITSGTAAHAGRDFDKGRNAVVTAARIALKMSELTDVSRGITVNIGSIEGGTAHNIVPDAAVCKINMRVSDSQDFGLIRQEMEAIVAAENSKGAAQAVLHCESWRPPKLFDEKTQRLFSLLQLSGEELGMSLNWRSSGGVCDGNTLAEVGVPVIDALGGIGGNLHTADEYVALDSVLSRAQLTLSFLIRYVHSLQGDSI